MANDLKELKVFSTYVEVILCLVAGLEIGKGILHVCGGDLLTWTSSKLAWQYSPRMWR